MGDDPMLEKLNTVEINHHESTVTKRHADKLGAMAEVRALRVLSNRYLGGSSLLKVPKLLEDRCSDLVVCMEYVPGIRLHDIFAILNGIIKSSTNHRLILDSFALKNALVAQAINAIRLLQSSEVQSNLQTAMGPSLVKYDFRSKFLEAFDYAGSLLGVPPTKGVLDDVETLSSVLEMQATVVFRDASLKNVIVMVPGLGEAPETLSSSTELPYIQHRPSDVQWIDPRPITKLLVEGITAHDLADQWYHLDFESAFTLSSPQDDFIHVLTFETVGLGYEAAKAIWSKHLPITEESYNYATVFRCFREWARRLFYRNDRPATYATRYYHETLSYHFHEAFTALDRLRTNSSQANLLGGLRAVMSAWKPTQEPWPWVYRQ